MRRYPRLDNVENRRDEMSMDWNINSKHVRLSSTRRPFFGSEDSGDDFSVRLREYGTATGILMLELDCAFLATDE